MTDIENLPSTVSFCENGFATITITLPEEHVNGFVALLTSLASLFRGLCWKQKTNIEGIHARNKLKEEEKKQVLQAFEDDVCRTFKDYTKTSSNCREAVSLTASSIIQKYEFSSYDIVRNCLTKNKLLKKTGYYKSRHKIE